METTIWQGARTICHDSSDQPAPPLPHELMQRYDQLVVDERLAWTEHLWLKRRLGSGGQGVVFLSERRGADGFTLPLALKIFSPHAYPDERSYHDSMVRIGRVGCRIAQIQHDNLLDVQNFIERYRIRIMAMEWIDGFDLHRLMTDAMLQRVRSRVSNRKWTRINDVIVTHGPVHPRLKPGIAVPIIRQCLGGLAALHREEVVHGDIKPSNIMIKRTGHAKIVDFGAAIDLRDMPEQIPCTPMYAAPETLERDELTIRSDLASLGYVLIEMLSGKPLFAHCKGLSDLMEAKRRLPHTLGEILPPEIADSTLLNTICRRLTMPDPNLRYRSAEEADTDSEGFAEFQRSLIMGHLATEAEYDIREWLEELE